MTLQPVTEILAVELKIMHNIIYSHRCSYTVNLMLHTKFQTETDQITPITETYIHELGWLKRFELLTYTAKDDQGSVCKYCAIFSHEFSSKGCHQELNALVSQRFNNWKDGTEVFVATVKLTVTKVTTFWPIILFATSINLPQIS